MSLYIPANASNNTGSYNHSQDSVNENRVYIVNDKNELWSFTFPYESDGKIVPAKSEKIEDNVKQVEGEFPAKY